MDCWVLGVLGVPLSLSPPTASLSAIKTAYLKLVLKVHLDRNQAPKAADLEL